MNLSRKLWTGLGLCLCLGACKTSTSLTQIRLSLSKGYLYHPDSVEVRWQVEGAQEISIEGVATGLPPTGSKRLYFDETSNYKVVAKNEKESTSRNINVPIRIFALQVKADTLLKKGDMSTLSWKAPYAQRVSIREVDEQLPASGKMYIEPTTDTTFHFEAFTADGHITEKEVTIRVIAKDRFWVSKPYLHTGEQSVIHWNFPDAMQIKITSEADDTLMTKEPSGSFMSVPLGEQEAERKYLLNVEKKNGEVVTQKLALKKIIPYLKLQARPEKVSKGDEIKLRWNTRFIKDISLNGVAYNLPSKGEIKVTPLKKTIYQLSGIDDQGERHSTQVTVGVHYRKYIKGLVDINQLLPQTILFEITQVNLNEYPKRVTLRVIAVDTAGNFVSGLADSPALQQRYFSRLVETAGKQRKIQDFSVKEVNEMTSKPYAINLTLDYSGSMSGAIGYVEQATQALIVKKHKQDVMSIVKFDDQLKTITPLVQEEQKLLQSYPLRGMRGFGGGTALYASIDEGLRSLDMTNYNRTMILLTDGQENSSFVHQATHAFRASDVVRKARAAHAPIQIIALGSAPNQNIIDALAYLTGGYAYFAQSEQEVEQIYQEMSRLFYNYYEVSYTPVASDGEHFVALQHYNHNGKVTTSERAFLVGDQIAYIDQFDRVPSSYGPVFFKRKKPVAPLQALANFQFNEHQLEEQYKVKLQSYVTYLKENPDAVLEIFGHTDSVGEDVAQIVLSEKRAAAVKRYFEKQGIASTRLAIKGFGKRRPLWEPENTPWKARENRRVELLLLK